MKKRLCRLMAMMILLSGCVSGCAAPESAVRTASETGESGISVSSQNPSSEEVSSEPEKTLSRDDKTVLGYLEEALKGSWLITMDVSGLTVKKSLFFSGKSYRSVRFTSNGRFMLCQNGTFYEGETAPKVYTTVDLWSGQEYRPQDEPVSWSEAVLLSDTLIGCADGHVFDQSNPNRAPLRFYNIFFEAQEAFLQFDYGKTVTMDYFPYEIPENGPLSIGYDSSSEQYIVSYVVDQGERVPGVENFPPVYIRNRIGIAVFDKTGKEISKVLLPEKYYANFLSHHEDMGGLYDSPLTVLPDGKVLLQAYYAGNVSAQDWPPVVRSCTLLVNPETGDTQEIPYSWYDGERLATSPDGKYLYAIEWDASDMPGVIIKVENGKAEVDEVLTGSLQAWQEKQDKDIRTVLFGEDDQVYFSASGNGDLYPSLYRLVNDTGGAQKLFPLPPGGFYSLVDANEKGNVRFLITGATGANVQDYEKYREKIQGTEEDS